MFESDRKKTTVPALLVVVLVSAAMAWSQDTGTVTVSGETYTFDVTVCTFHGAQDFPVKMLSGRATDANGRLLFNIEIIAQETADTAQHSAQLTFTDRRQFIAQYSRSGGAWTRMGEPAEGGLIRVEGLRIVADGLFKTSQEEEAPVSVEVNCVHQD